MSDVFRGPGWWQGPDAKWYPPDQELRVAPGWTQDSAGAWVSPPEESPPAPGWWQAEDDGWHPPSRHPQPPDPVAERAWQQRQWPMSRETATATSPAEAAANPDHGTTRSGETYQFCSVCGAAAAAEAAFCGNCGQRLAKPTDSPVGMTASPQHHESVAPRPTVSPCPPVPPAQGPQAGVPLAVVPQPSYGTTPASRPPGAPATSTNTLSILSLVFAFLFWPLGIIFGHVARSQTRRTGAGGHGLALAGLIISYMFGAITIFGIVLVASSSNTTTTSVVGRGSTPAKSAHVGSTLTIPGMSLMLQRVIDPAQGVDYETPNSGDRFVGVEMMLTNTGRAAIQDDANNNVSLVGSDGQTYISDVDAIAECTDFNSGTYTLAPGESSTGCVTFQVPDGVTVKKVEFTSLSGLGSNSAEWQVP